ncbi:MAG: polymer-forming cytoskeletal protein [Prolixibacteraceae bacterium]|nr:polymer-forming cytoskeletal protein [Prolixibacteraceae bacterium]
MKLTIIGKKMQLTGELISSDDIRVDGRYTGYIRTRGKLVVSKEGVVSGNVYAKNITIHGKSEGDFVAENTFQIDPGGSFEGSVKTRFINITDSAYFNGTCAIIPGEDFNEYERDFENRKTEIKKSFEEEYERSVTEEEYAGKLLNNTEMPGSPEDDDDNVTCGDENHTTFISSSLSKLKSL